MNNEMIERAAKALWNDNQEQPHIKYGFSNVILFGDEFKNKAVPWEHIVSEDIVPSIANEYRNKVKLVIKAIREPTEEMKSEGANASHSYLGADESIGYEGANDVWQSMIDEILK